MPVVHDLVRFEPAYFRDSGSPAWVAQRVKRAPWAVVRREHLDGAIAIGIRGETRAERHAATILPQGILATVTPWELDVAASKNERLRDAYRSIAEVAISAELHIAPVGSFGFEIGSGEPVTHAASDLDLIVDAVGVSRQRLAWFRSAVDRISRATAVPVDAELSYEIGGVALRELLEGRPSVLFKTGSGPRLLPCPV